jgi:hypothetical protein
MKVLAEGANMEALTLAIVFLGRVAVGSLLAGKGIDSFADFVLSKIIIALLERGTSSSSSELIKADMDSSKLKRNQEEVKRTRRKKELTKLKLSHRLLRRILMVFL